MHFTLRYSGYAGNLTATLGCGDGSSYTETGLKDKKAAKKWAAQQAREHKLSITPEAVESHTVVLRGSQTFTLQVAAASKPGLSAALLAFQQEGVELQKGAINPHYGHKYISLDVLMGVVMPVLNKLGVVLLQWPTALERTTEKDGPVSLGTAPALRTKLIHVASGESMEDVTPLMLDKQNSQGLGSALTYTRRYALMSILGLVADVDDDGNAASPKQSYAPPTSGGDNTGAGDAATPDAASLGI